MNEKFIERIRRINLIDLISEITNILNIDNIANIENIETIRDIKNASFLSVLIKNGDFELGDLTYWKGTTEGVTIVTNPLFEGEYSVLLYNMSGYMNQDLLVPIPSNYVYGVSVAAIRKAPYTSNILLRVDYTDGTWSTESFTTLVIWKRFIHVPDANKVIRRVGITNETGGDGCYADAVEIILNNTVEVKQATAANLNANVFTKHDNAIYKTATFYADADGDIVPLVAAKKIKVHYLDIQAQGTVTVTIRNDNVGGTQLDEWKLQDREGAVKPFLQYPASHYVTLQTAGKALYADLSAAVMVKINVVYTDADAS